MKEMVHELEGKLIKVLVAAGVLGRPRDLVDRPYSFYYRCGVSNEGRAMSVGKIIAIEFEENVGIILRVSHTRLISGAEVLRIIYKKGEWCLVTRNDKGTDYYPGYLEIH